MRVFAYEDRRGDVEVAFTDRSAGTLVDADNLAAAAMAMAGAAVAPAVVTMDQVHGGHVEFVPTAPHRAPVADGLVTDQPGLLLITRAADCVPVLLADPERGVVGAVHAGRAGLAADVVPRAVDAVAARGAANLVAWIGPHVCGSCYEVPAQLRDEVAEAVPGTWSQTSWDTPALDLGAGVEGQLSRAGVEVVRVPGCTLEDPTQFSYRREGAVAGRHGGLIWVRP